MCRTLDENLPLRTPGDDVELLLRHADPDVRLCGIRMAAHLGLALLKPDLLALAGDPDNEVRLQVAWALGRLTPGGGNRRDPVPGRAPGFQHCE